MGKTLTLVLGGARAGKSSYAQQLAAGGGRVLFVATAEAGDEEMRARIEAHRLARPGEWVTLEEPINLADALAPVLDRYDTILLDCLTLWVSNLLLRSQDFETTREDVLGEVQRLLDTYRSGNTSWIVVSNEVGMGVVPSTKLGRIYADELGRVNQIVASEADAVYLMVSGIPVDIKKPKT